MRILENQMVVGGGFGPPKAWPVDLQSTAFDRSATPPGRKLRVERVEGIEPSQLAWKANVLPLNYTRRQFSVRFITIHLLPDKSSPEHKKSGKKPPFPAEKPKKRHNVPLFLRYYLIFSDLRAKISVGRSV